MRSSALVPVLILFCVAAPLAGAESRHVVLEEIPLELNGVSESMWMTAQSVIVRQLKLAQETSISPPLADDLAFFLQSRYHQSGYAEARVDWEVNGDTGVILVNEGERYTVGKITFTGVDPDQEPELAEFLTRQTRERDGKTKTKQPYVETDIEAGVGLVQRKLQADGYLDATVAEPQATPNAETKSMDLAITAVRGKRYVFGTVTLSGNTDIIPDTRIAEVQALTGKPFNEVSLENLRKQLQGECQALGYHSAEVVASSTLAVSKDGVVSASLVVNPGELSRITEVRVSEDFSRGARHVATGVFNPAVGEIYTPEALTLMDRRAVETGIYERLEITPTVTAPGEISLLVSGTEAKPKTLGFYVGYETFVGPIAGIEARHVNFLDSGNTVLAEVDWNGLGLGGNLGWVSPAIFDSRNALAVNLLAQTFSFKAYAHVSLGLRATLTRRFTRRITAEAFAAFTLNSLSTDELTPLELGPDTYSTALIGSKITFDYRDNPLSPHRGWVANAGIESGFEAGGGEVQYSRLDVGGSYYHPISDRWRVAFSARSSALLSSAEQSDFPITLRLFNGGANSVRSFPEREMGPISAQGDTPLGGTATTVVNAEISHEIISNLELAAFADAGNLSQDASSVFSMDTIRYALGVGLRYQLPIGPLRVDYGINPDRHKGEPFGALHVTFGFAF